MGSPSATTPATPLSSKTTEASTFNKDQTRTRQRIKRSKIDMHDGRAFYSTRQLSMRPMYPIPYPPPCYPYPPMAHNDAAMYHPQMYYPVARRDPYSDMLPPESHILKMSLDNEKVPVKSTQAAPPVPPPTPSSTATEASSPTSTSSAHLAGSESARLLEEQQAPRERANSCGSFYRTKPCKFFHERGSCVKGNRCNFIHDYNQDRRGSVSESDSQPQSSDTTAHFSSRRRRVPKRPLHVQVEDGDKRSNFYPVMWRVISGRTMMGGPRQVCQDFLRGACTRTECKYAHPMFDEEDDLSDTSSSSYYDARDFFPPVSPPLYPNSYHYYQHVPLVAPVVVEPVPSEPPKIVEARATQTPTVLDGKTLLPLNDPAADESAPDSAELMGNTLLPPREIERPWSTPPGSGTSLCASSLKSVQLFPAEMP